MKKDYYSQVVALTGNIGSGKSTVSKQLVKLGAYLVDADSISHQLLQVGTRTYQEIKNQLGNSILDQDSKINRKKLGRLVFNDPQKLNQLENILHPEIRKAADEEFRRAIEENTELIIYMAPLFFEKGMEQLGFKSIITVATDKEKCIERIRSRDEMSEAEASNRINLQLPIEDKIKKSDYIIYNNKTLDELKTAVVALYKKLLSKK